MFEDVAAQSSRTFFLKTFVPVIAGTLLLFAVTAAFLVWSTRGTDELSIANQRTVVERAVDRLHASIARDQESRTVGGETLVRVKAGNTDWMDANLGGWMHAYFGHDELYVLDPRDRPLFAFAHGFVADQAAFARIATTVRPMVAALRAKTAAGEKPDKDSRLQTVGVTDYALIDARPAIVSVKPITGDRGELDASPDCYVHVAIRFLDRDFLSALAAEYGLSGLRFSWLVSPADDNVGITIRSSATTINGFFVWTPDLPGLAFVEKVTPWLAGIGGLLLLAVIVLMLALHRLTLSRAATEARLGFLANHDPQTGLPNLGLVQQALDAAIAALPGGEGDKVVAFAIIDLDDLKRVNDAFGRQGGDLVVTTQAQRIAQMLDGRAMLGRLSGDEFSIALWDRTQAEVATLFAEIVLRLSMPIVIGTETAACGASLGYALAPDHGTENGELIRKAGVALHQAKIEGRNRATQFGRHMDMLLSDRAALERDLLASLDNGTEIEVHYQPKLSASGLRVVGLEALARWQHPQRGWVSPAVFIPIAEECGFIHRLGLHVLETACRDAAHWHVPSIAVNVASCQLRDPTFVLEVARILADCDLPPSHLELELTEGSWMDERGICGETIRTLRGLGIRIALDDFGTGFSSFGRLHANDVDRIKIDQSFVAGFGKARGDEAIVRAIIDMAKAKGLATTAEGVETAEQCSILQEMGCDDLQGYLFSRPLPACRMENFLGGPSGPRMGTGAY